MWSSWRCSTPTWVELFDDEYGVKYDGSRHYRPDADEHSRPVCPPSPTRSLRREDDSEEEGVEAELVQEAQAEMAVSSEKSEAAEDGSIELGVQCGNSGWQAASEF